jgi:ElaB/YqjD/DUF883 family membrane-anchored ribosome-binding protein
MSHYETPEALRNDASTLADDTRSLLNATAEIADEKVAQARKRLQSALASGRIAVEDLQVRAREKARAAEECIRDHPLESVAVAFGVGTILGVLLSRRS